MFMTAREITAQYQPLDADRNRTYDDRGLRTGWEDDAQVWDRKNAESEVLVGRQAVSLSARVLRDGVRSPVILGSAPGTQGKPQVVSGHHRIAIMNEHQPDDLIPVQHEGKRGNP